MNRETLLTEKWRKIQAELDRWAQETQILSTGEQIVFSIQIRKSATVVREFQNMPLHEFFTAARLRNAGENHFVTRIPHLLNRSRIRTLGDLLNCTHEELLRIRGFGAKTVTTIETILAQEGFQLKP